MSAAPDTPVPQLDLTFAPDRGGVTRLVRRRVRYPYTFLKPFWFGDQPEGIATAMLQSASGGLFGGERLGQTVTLARGAAVHVTTQAAAIVHAARGQPATEQQVRLRLGPQAFLEYLPEPMILFPGAGLAQQIAAELDPAAVLLFGDGIVRHDPGPTDAPFATYRSDLEVFLPDGRLLFADRAEIAGADFDRVLQCRGAQWRACGLFAIAAPAAADRHAALAAALNESLDPLTRGEGAAVYAASAALPNRAGVACRIAASGGAELRAALEACWRSARFALTGAPPPRRRK